MKISTFVSFMVVIAAVFFIFNQAVFEANTQYPTANINASAWNESYDYTNELNNTMTPLKQKFEVIQDENEGFFTKLAAGITAIPYAVILVPQAVFESMVIGGKILTGFLSALGLPGQIVIYGILLLVMWGIFKLLEFFQRTAI